MQKAGRFTAGLLVLAVGAALLLGEAADKDYIGEWFKYWPVLLIVLGVEYLILNGVAHAKNRHLRLDAGVLLLSVVVSLAVIVFVQGSLSLGGTRIGWMFNWGDERERIAKQPIMLEWDDSIRGIRVDNPIGNVVVMADDTVEPQIQVSVAVNSANREEAQKIADESVVHVERGETLNIRAEGAKYRSWWLFSNQARMDLVIITPKASLDRLELDLMGGDVTVTDVALSGHGNLRTTNGDIRLTRVQAAGGLTAATFNGSIVANTLNGPAKLDTKNGDIQVVDASSEVQAKTLNGEITLKDVGGHVLADTRNGDVRLTNPGGNVQAHTTNGDIVAESGTIGGDWDIDTSVGDVRLKLPRSGDYAVEGKSRYGDVSSSLDLDVRRQQISGRIGSGTHKINVASGGDLRISMQE